MRRLFDSLDKALRGILGFSVGLSSFCSGIFFGQSFSSLSTSSFLTCPTMASTALALPGAQPVVAPAPAAGLEKLEPRFIAMLQERSVPEAVMVKIASQREWQESACPPGVEVGTPHAYSFVRQRGHLCSRVNSYAWLCGSIPMCPFLA